MDVKRKIDKEGLFDRALQKYRLLVLEEGSGASGG
jgi:hypothetical protein